MAGRASDSLSAVPDRPVLTLLLGDVVRLRRRHPCGGDTWLVDRLGADIGLRCRTCSRHVLLERPTLERRFAAWVERGDQAVTAALAPAATEAVPGAYADRPVATDPAAATEPPAATDRGAAT
jgi:hypothetical protein